MNIKMNRFFLKNMNEYLDELIFWKNVNEYFIFYFFCDCHIHALNYASIITFVLVY